MDGLLEQAVRDTLPNRPAGVIANADLDLQHTFAGLFNGAKNPGWLNPGGGLFVGKAECEWHWPRDWDKLKELGLIDYATEERPNHPDFGGTTTYVKWSVTEKGWQVREDDLKWLRIDDGSVERRGRSLGLPHPR